MKKSFKTLLTTYPKRKRPRIKQLLENHEYRADLFIHDFTSKILNKLDLENKTRKELADDLNVSRSAITQILNPENISVKKMFELANSVGLTLEFVELVDLNVCLNNTNETKLGVEPNTTDNHYKANVIPIGEAQNLKTNNGVYLEA